MEKPLDNSLRTESSSFVTSRLNAALAKAQGQFPSIVKNATAKVQLKAGGSYTFDYADLSEITEKVTPVLSANELSIVNLIRDGSIVCQLRHASGEYIESSLPLSKSDRPQDLGSQLTYFRRYLLSSILALATDADDDGAAVDPHAAGAQFERRSTSTNSPAAAKPVSATTPVVTGPQGEFEITFGTNRGKKIKDVSTSELANMVGFIKNGSSPTWSNRPDVQLLLTAIEMYLKTPKS